MRSSKFRRVIVFFFNILIIFVWCGSSKAQTSPVSPAKTSVSSEKKKPFPVFELPVPQNDAQKNYLGITGSGRFKITQIKSPVIIIEVFSTDCPHCQKAISSFNELYLTIQGRPGLKEKIKIIGIVDKNAYKVDLFRAKYKVAFPLFSDPNDVISKKLGVKKIPAFFGVKNNHDGTMEEFYSKTGDFLFWNADRFLKKIINLSKLETGGQ
jgi:peroxiredoxin